MSFPIDEVFVTFFTEFNECLLCLFTLQKGEYEVPDWLSPGDFTCTAYIIWSMFTLDALRALYPRKKKTFRVAENRCLQRVESIFVNLPQFAKSGLKESLNTFFWYFPLHLFGYFGLVSSLFVSVSVCFTAVLSMAAPSKLTVERPRRRGSPQYIRLRESVFLISGEMGKKLLAANSTNRVFAEFLLHRMLMFNRKQRCR